MGLETGRTLLHYRLAEKIGEGGMGVVWRAEDTTLGREVAIKILPDVFAGSAERLARFEREAKLLASLNHPNIAGIYGLHEADGVRFLAMELVPGEDLAQRLGRGPLATEQALELARQIAEALEAAHDNGVIHRDLKPANVKLTGEGNAKVLDFGLAKAFEPDATASGSSPTLSPTLTSAGTVAGMVLGTAAYMAPEQARGHAVDKRADIFAFGCLLYELLSGRLAFAGDTVSDTLASVLKLEPDWNALPAATPRTIRRLLGRCLEKDARRRLRDIGEARIRLEEALRGAAEEETSVDAGATTAEAPRGRRRWLPWAVAGGALLLAAGAIGWTALRRDGPSTVMRLEVRLSDVGLSPAAGATAVLSPDGSRIAYVAGDNGALHVRPIGQFEGTELSGTAGASQPFFSPDGEWIGFFADGKMKKVSVFGGATMTLCDVRQHRGASWGADDTIVLAPHVTEGLHRVPAGGGEPEELTAPDADKRERSHRWPQILPGGRAVLFTAQDQGTSFDEARIEVLDLETKQRKLVQAGGSYGRYVPTGHVVYVHEGTMFAAPFDAKRLERTGPPMPVVEQIGFDIRNGGAQYDFSQRGDLLYVTGDVTDVERKLVWLDFEGNTTPLLDEARSYRAPALSPDGKRLALNLTTGTNDDIWIYDLERGALTRLTFDEALDMFPFWTPDGRRIVYSSTRGGSAPNLYWKPADGSGEAERLTESDNAQFPDGVSPDGTRLVFHERGPETGWDIRVLPLEGGGQAETFLQTSFSERKGRVSPDGSWIAYVSEESGRREIYVRPFPSGGGKWQVSVEGGVSPRWSRDGKLLYFHSGRDLLAAEVSADGPTFRARTPRVLLGDALPLEAFSDVYDVTADGRRVVTFEADDEGGGEPITHAMLVLGWFDELRAKSR